MKAGDTFHLPDFAGGHINFCLEAFDDGSVITCNFTDYAHIDKACVVDAGEHPDVTKKSVVNFKKAHHCEDGQPKEALERLIGGKYKKPLNPDLLARIRKAALDSPHTSDDIKAALKAKDEKANQSRERKV
jgi:hypothetical protein